jgi:hypothetical protein
MPLVTLVGKNSNSFSTFFVSNALMIAISPSYTVGRLSGQTFLASVIESSAAATCTRRRNLTGPFSSDARRLSASAFGARREHAADLQRFGYDDV